MVEQPDGGRTGIGGLRRALARGARRQPCSTGSILDERRSSSLGGDKTGHDRWYEEHVPRADDLYDQHVAALKAEGVLPHDER